MLSVSRISSMSLTVSQVVFPSNRAAGSDFPIEDRDGSEHYADARARLLAFVSAVAGICKTCICILSYQLGICVPHPR
jgi:hypothetical protein